MLHGEFIATEKLCRKCEKVKPVGPDGGEFALTRYRLTSGEWGIRVNSHCRQCNRQRLIQFQAENKDRLAAEARAKRLKDAATINGRDRESRRQWKMNLKKLYGLNVFQYEAIYRSQGGRCKICERQMKTISVDHCHGSKEVRGLLCRPCNLALGNIRESEAAALRMAAYITERCQIKSPLKDFLQQVGTGPEAPKRRSVIQETVKLGALNYLPVEDGGLYVSPTTPEQRSESARKSALARWEARKKHDRAVTSKKSILAAQVVKLRAEGMTWVETAESLSISRIKAIKLAEWAQFMPDGVVPDTQVPV